jgi:hypothetical protein
LFIASLVLGIVGSSLTITTPGKHGEMGLAITCLALTALVLLLSIVWFFSPSLVVAYLLPLLEISRILLFAIFQWAVCKSLREASQGSSALTVGITLPSVIFGSCLFMWLMVSVIGPKMGRAGGHILFILLICMFGAFTGLSVWYTLVTKGTGEAIQYRA